MTPPIPSRNAEGAAAGALAPNYHPLPVTLTTGEGAWVRDTDGRTYSTCSPGTRRSTSGTGTPR